MPSVFPGVDPYLESQGFWPDFHTRFINYWCEAIADALPDQYEARIEEHVSLVEVSGSSIKHIGADVAVERRGGVTNGATKGEAGGVATLGAETIPLVIEETQTQRSIRILRRPGRTLVTVLELLSPANKEEPGRRSFLEKRNVLLHQPVHLVEVDLLRGGQRPPLARDYPAGDYYALVAQVEQRPNAQVYGWGIRQGLPTLPVPLNAPDAPVLVDLAKVYSTAFDRGRFARAIDYTAAPTAVAEADREWARERARARS